MTSNITKLITEAENEIGEIISRAILDGQNQIHDLSGGKASGEEINDRMQKSYDFHFGKAKSHLTLIAERAWEEGEKDERERLLNQKANHHDNEVRMVFASRLKEKIEGMFEKSKENVGSSLSEKDLQRGINALKNGWDERGIFKTGYQEALTNILKVVEDIEKEIK